MSVRYLSKIEIDHETAFKTGLRDSYDWHQKSWKAFPQRDGKSRDFLTRLDEIDGGFRLLILSASEPSKPDWCPDECWDSKIVGASFYDHSTYRFSLLANPTKKIRSGPNGKLLKNSRRVPLSRREDLLGWLESKAAQSGFSVDLERVKTVPKPRRSFVKKGRVGLHTATEYIGILRVADRDLFTRAVGTGVGSAKAFGFGMLCLSPLS